MSEISLQAAQRLTTLMAGASKSMGFYPVGHPAVAQPLNELFNILREQLQREPDLNLGIMDGVLFVDEHLFVTPFASANELVTRLSDRDIAGIKISRGIQQEELSQFIVMLAEKAVSVADIRSSLEQGKFPHMDIKFSSEPTPEVEEDPEETAAETYNRALTAIRGVFRDIENGRIPSSSKVISVVNNLMTLTIQDPTTLLGLAMIKDYDNYTFNHSVNVGVLAMALGTAMNLKREEIEELGVAGFLHDIGKTKIDKNILNKPGKLSAQEFEQMKQHSEIGANIIKEMEGINPEVSQAVLGHHIRYNRQGYPEWAQHLPFNYMSEVIAIADCYDAITTLRVYQHPMNPKAAIDQMNKLSGNVLNSALVATFIKLMGKYPVGTLVRLDNNEIAVVFRPNPSGYVEAPVVKVIIDSNGTQMEAPIVRQLVDESGTRYAEIVAIVDPLVKNIDVSMYLT
jgi:putative nucleotidyltransferase with HDIG domain